MEGKALVAVLRMERAAIVTDLAKCKAARTKRFSASEIAAKQEQLDMVEIALGKAKLKEVDVCDTTKSIVDILEVQRRLSSKIVSQLKAGGKNDRNIASAYVCNMLMLRAKPVHVSDIRKQLESKGYFLKNWHCFMSASMKCNSNIKRISKGWYEYRS